MVHVSDPIEASSALPEPGAGSAARALGRRALLRELAHGACAELLAGLPDPTLVIDAHGRVLLASRSIEALTGWKSHELVGRDFGRLVPRGARRAQRSGLAAEPWQQRAGVRPGAHELVVLHRDGRELCCEFSLACVELEGHAQPYFVGSLRDTSARQPLAERRDASGTPFRGLFDQLGAQVLLLSPSGALRDLNRMGPLLDGRPLELVVGRRLWDLPPWSEDAPAALALRKGIERAAAGETVCLECESAGAPGADVVLDLALKPLRGARGGVEQLLLEVHDVSVLRRAQRTELSMLRALAELGESAALLAHEIKNPITAVHLALTAVAHELGADHRAVLDDLVARMQRLEQMLRRTLSFARPLVLKPEEFRLRELVAGLCRELGVQAAAQGTALSYDVHPADLCVRADRALLEEALANLLRNGLEALRRGGRLHLEARRLGQGRIELWVDDDGPGLPEHLRAHLFRPFATTKEHGAGLGLAFCRKVVEQHGGQICAASSPLGGARFHLVLPIAR